MSQIEPLNMQPTAPLTTTVPNPEVRPRAKHRQFTTAYKQRILDEAATCTDPGQLGALLRQEGLYSSLLSKWRQQQRQAARTSLQPKKRGPKVDLPAQELARLQLENQRLQERLRQAELIIDVQKKVSLLLGAPLETVPESNPNSSPRFKP
jgi:transposase